MVKLIEKIRQLLTLQIAWAKKTPMRSDMSAKSYLSAGGSQSLISEEILKKLMRELIETKEGQFSCAETSELLDEYVDLVSNRQEAAILMPFVKAHLDVCPDCSQKFEILKNILQTDKG